MKNIYIRFANEDVEVAESLTDFLRRESYNVIVGFTSFNGRIAPGAIMEDLRSVDLAIVIISQDYVKSPSYKSESNVLNKSLTLADIPLLLIVIDDSTPQFGFAGIPYTEVDKKDILNGNFETITRSLEIVEAEIYQAQTAKIAEKESKKEVIKRISDSSELKEVILNLKNKEKFNKGIAIGCYFVGIAVIITGAILAYFSVSNIPSDKKSYYYIYVGAKNLAIIGVLILCSRYTFNIGKIFMEEAVKHSDRLHAIHYGKFFLESFQEKLTFGEMKELFKDWNMDNKPLASNNPDPTAAISNTSNTNLGSESAIVDQIGKIADILSNLKK